MEQTIQKAPPEYMENDRGKILNNCTNYSMWLNYRHPDTFAYNLFCGQVVIMKALPWGKKAGEWLQDRDIAMLRREMEGTFPSVKKDILIDAISVIATEHEYHPIRQYFESLPAWDGTPRLDTLLIRYLGVEDDEEDYARTVTRKSFVACVARVFEPGCKHDEMLIVYGKQGLEKSSLFRIMGGEWFSDSLTSFGDKAAMEQLGQAWLIEIPELNSLTKRDSEDVKAFLSKTRDAYRAAYARYVSDLPRQCVFFGSTNVRECLKDWVNRRFWVVDGDKRRKTLSSNRDLPAERDQLWAEALYRYRQGETLYLDDRMAKIAERVASDHRSMHPWEDQIKDFLETPVPAAYYQTYTLGSRVDYITENRGRWGDPDATVKHARICALQIWTECLGRDPKEMKIQDSKVIVQIIENLGWEGVGARRLQYYGSQRCYERKE